MDAGTTPLRRQNNFDFMRFVAASAVILSHAFPLTTGDAATEPLNRLSGGQTSFGHLAVACFFVISGLLITRSFERSGALGPFLKARALRILPGLAVVLAFAAFVIGPLVTSLPLGAYLTSPETYKYLAGINMVAMPADLPGVFGGNPYAPAVNGSLWTLWYEVQCYLVVAALGVAGLLKRGPVLLLMAAAAVAMPLVEGSMHLRAELFLFFGGGMCLHLFRDHVRADRRLAWLAGAVLVATLLSGRGFSYAFAVGGTYLIFCAAYARWQRLAGFGRRGDVSYGIYVYAFPIQQTLIHLSGGQMTWWANALLAFPITLLLAHASWRWVEAPALAWKDRPLRELLPARLRPVRVAVDG